ncbi:pilus assembly protein [Candidatus Scalindua japonica]|uniref:Pilus assembly protein n=1 Tax=Candidatus Scalindua japonica TaxID=1284222 RepID=A0A286TYC5_9BACT|nr:hypothetical protein [Candidatus Scalindua japonica]GAX60866.1 pilus assembly protein [Candidatus Scalindua japonica]
MLNNKAKIVNLKSNNGFTLIEIGIAVFILGIGLISMLTLFPIGVDSMKKVEQYSNTSVLVESVISYLQANDVVGFVGTNTGNNTYPDTDPDQDNQFTDSYGNTISAQYSWQAVVQNVTADNNLVRAQIAIFKNFDPTQFAGAETADFAASTTVSNVSAFPSWLTSKHYIRSDSDKFWYRINNISIPGRTIMLEGPFLGSTGNVTFSTTDKIIDIYETMFSNR